MILNDYKCIDCGNIQDYWKKSIMDEWPKYTICEKCGGNCEMLIGAPLIDIPVGRVGNAKNGYNKVFTGYQHSEVIGRVSKTGRTRIG